MAIILTRQTCKLMQPRQQNRFRNSWVVSFCLGVCCLLANNPTIAAEGVHARDYNLSMAGALISDNCERNWQTSSYISLHACNYQLAQHYNLEISQEHFEGCVVIATGDLVKIAECMTERFNQWLADEKI